MLERWGWFVVRRCRLILAVALLGTLAAGWLGLQISDRLSHQIFVQPGSEADRGKQFLEDHFGVGLPNLTLLVSARSGSVDDPAAVTAAEAVVARLAAEPGITDVASYWTMGRPPQLRSATGGRALVVARIPGDDKAVNDRLKTLVPRYTGDAGAVEVRAGGFADTLRELVEVSIHQFKRAETFTVPVILVALVVVFGSVVAALLPLLVALGAVVGTTFMLWVMTHFTEVNFFALTLTSALGLGLAIDYSLFVVSRFREELGAGHDTGEAVVRTVRTAGRTVLFSATAVAVSIAGLLTMPLQLLRSMGYGIIFTALLAGAAAVVALPALLALLGPRVDRLRVFHRRTRPETTGVWYRLAIAVMRRPVVVGGAVIAVLVVLGLPFLHVDPGLVDDREMPKGARSRTVGDILRAEFPTAGNIPLSVVLPDADPAARSTEIDSFAAAVAGLPSVSLVETATGRYTAAGRMPAPPELAARYGRDGSTYVQVLTTTQPLAPESNRLIRSIRALPHPFQAVLVTGEPANLFDINRSVIEAVPKAVLLIALTAGLALFVQFGSLLVPLKAIALNTLSLSALFGMLVWGFQDGHLSGLLDFTATGQIYILMPIMLFALAFGLSMDYELFLLSRIKEEYDRTGDNEAAVALGLERSGRIVSAAAVLISLVFLTTALTASLTLAKIFAWGLSVVVLVDAFVIRGTLVPAFMKLAGSANWWAPRPLRRLHARIGVPEHVDLDAPQPALSQIEGS